MASLFNTSVTNGLKLKVRKFWGLIPMLVEIRGEKQVEGLREQGTFCTNQLRLGISKKVYPKKVFPIKKKMKIKIEF